MVDLCQCIIVEIIDTITIRLNDAWSRVSINGAIYIWLWFVIEKATLILFWSQIELIFSDFLLNHFI